MRNKIKNEIIDNKNYIYLAYAISVLTIIPQVVITPDLSDFKRVLFLSIVLIILFSLSKFSKVLFSMLAIYLNISNVMIGHVIIHWGYGMGKVSPRMDVAIISPKNEMIEYMMTYIDYRDFLLILYTVVVLILIFIYLVHFKHSFKIFKIVGFVFIVAIISTVSFYINPLKKIEPFSFPYRYMKALENSYFCKNRLENIQSIIKDSSINNKDFIYDKVVVIQGEAVNKHHMSIYNYDRATTPFLSSLKKNNNLYVFNAISPTNETRFSIPILHTEAQVHDFSKFLYSRSIVGIFKLYNYKTYWISNQGQSGKHDDAISTMAREASVNTIMNLKFFNAEPDEKIISYLDNIKDNSEKEMYFIHLMGSHASYTRRYTKKHVLFKKATNVVEQYDNTIFYTDYILKEVFKYFITKFTNKKILFVYISDHGEVVHKHKHGHPFNPPYKDELDVPFVIYSTVLNDRIDVIYSENEKGSFNLENLNYMIEYVTGIRDEYNISYSKDVFTLDQKNIYNYDNLEYYKE